MGFFTINILYTTNNFLFKLFFISILLLSYAFEIFHRLAKPRHTGVSLSPNPGVVARPGHLECGVRCLGCGVVTRPRRLGFGVVTRSRSLGCVVVARSKRMNLVWLPGLDNLGLTCLSDQNNMNLVWLADPKELMITQVYNNICLTFLSTITITIYIIF